jgi:putative transposase
MKNTAKRRDEGQGGSFQQLVFAAMADARSTLHDAVVQAGMTVLGAMLEEDRAKLCGRRYAHDTERSATRAGYTDGELAMGGRRVTIERPRVRGANNREIRLPTWERFASADPLTPRAVEQMVLGVSTRNYARSIEPAPEHVRSRGTSKSAVSRRFVGATREQLVQMMSRDISEVPLCAVMIDGIHLAEHLVLVALGIDEQGEKHVLGLYEGAAENSTVDRSMLFVIDGSKALAKAIRRVVGAKAILQRCQVHKRRNVEDHLPEDMKKSVGRTISAAYHSDNAP